MPNPLVLETAFVKGGGVQPPASNKSAKLGASQSHRTLT